MLDRQPLGVLDTDVYIDYDVLSPALLPITAKLTSVTLAELHQGVAMAKTAASRGARMERLRVAETSFEPLPFDTDAAARFGTLVGLTLAAGRDPRSRKLDLMIAAIASTQRLPLFTRNVDDYKGLEQAVTVFAV